ncbi:hypothetical protein [Hymenobacter terrenus]|uniref:hypothetical protein n=1 Tax=Hymenobacter terrenus TaxID=1629124 RepID=UPI0012E0AEB9|nr:hypothetical protein [Hymenobacter terrenus]
MKYFLLVFLMVWGSMSTQAQIFYLDLTYQVLTVPLRVVTVEQVVDGRAGNPPIGIAYRGLGGKSVAIQFQQGLGPELTAFVQSQLPARPTDHVVVLCLRRLQLTETLGGNKELALADMTADVYERLPDGYHFVQSVAAQASSRGSEVTYQHAAHMAQMLSRCLGQLTQADWSAVAARPVRTLAALPVDVPASLASGRRGTSVAVLREAPRRGLYYRFEQFLANRPDTSQAFLLDTIKRRTYHSWLATVQWKNVARVRPLVRTRAGGRMRAIPPDLWGFSDGQQVFVKYEKQFYPLMRQGNFFTFVGEAPLDLFFEQAQSQAAGRAGLVAGAVGAALARTNVPDHTAEPMAYGLDMSTGAVVSYPSLRTPLRPDTAYVYIYRPAQAVGAEEVQVLVNGQEIGALRAGQYLEVPWARFGSPLQLCLNGVAVNNPCQHVVPNAWRLNYLKINTSKNAHVWQWMPPAKGSADLDELDRRTK